MANSYTVALVGFTDSESTTFDAFFRLAARRPPEYRVQDEVADAQLLIVNADNTQALHLVRQAKLPGQVLLVGHSDGGTGWPLQRKPIKLVSVLGLLDALVGVRMGDAAARAPVAARRFDATGFPPTRLMVRRPVAPTAAESARFARPGVMGLSDFGGLEELPQAPAAPRVPGSRAPGASRPPKSTHGKSPAAAVPELPRGDLLLVAESLVEGRILHKRFKKYGLTIDWSREAPQALAMMQANAYRAVVIDRLNGQPDAYQICRGAKQRKLANGQSPVVIMFAPAAGSMDRIKAGLAGSDAYLPRSVNEVELYKVLARHRLVSQDDFRPTNIGF
ncbi:hypothetical protein KIH07_04630 [Hydrogenophaga taeniospiralis]|uniref:hypothetical protein n=1 Tax=Hydrogenophaga taeniospiralis TaxID=65656 RepID=UPI001CF9C521|nr:hypothetical protein [Hydrogenophaga taeniospiralis]MCB4363006.1 hypothetical protein [Hydrogenophaga taeniospiralis]